MPKFRLTIEGQEPRDINVKMSALVAAERHYGNKAFEEHPIEAGMYGAWFALGMPGGKDGFEAWQDTVENFEPASDPTGAATAPAEPSEPSPQ